MLAYQIVAGFSDIKSELRKQFHQNKNLGDLQLWFSFEQDAFYAHDYQDHPKCMTLAIYNRTEKTWQVTFGGGTYGKRLIQHAINNYDVSDLTDKFHYLYRSHGYITFR